MKKTKQKITRKLLSVVFIILLIFSCKKENKESVVTGVYIFSFFEKVSTIEVDETVKSFEFGGEFSVEPSQYSEGFPVSLDKERTTARHNVHFINNISRKYDRKDGLKVYQTIKLIPENIKSEVQIVYYHSSYFDGKTYDDSTIIRLIPKITTQKLKEI